MTRKEQIRQDADALAVELSKQIGAAAWYDCADKVLTVEEKAEIDRRFREGPGRYCWNTHFFAWMKQAD